MDICAVPLFSQRAWSGILQTKSALFIRDGYISLRTVALLVRQRLVISLASGIALGREGPSVQIGAGIVPAIGRRFGLGSGEPEGAGPGGVLGGAGRGVQHANRGGIVFASKKFWAICRRPCSDPWCLSSATPFVDGAGT